MAKVAAPAFVPSASPFPGLEDAAGPPPVKTLPGISLSSKARKVLRCPLVLELPDGGSTGGLTEKDAVHRIASLNIAVLTGQGRTFPSHGKQHVMLYPLEAR